VASNESLSSIGICSLVEKARRETKSEEGEGKPERDGELRVETRGGVWGQVEDVARYKPSLAVGLYEASLQSYRFIPLSQLERRARTSAELRGSQASAVGEQA
jgi:hypothetical protein